MNRRAALHALGVGGAAFLMPRRVWSQKPPPVVAVPLIAAGPDDPIIIDLRKGLVAYGYIDGKNIQILYRSSGGTVERLPSLLRELVRLKVDIIVAGAAPIVAAARDATSTIPIIMVGWDYDPVAAGFVDSLSHPGGNVTGVYLSTEETTGKRLELITELLPGVSHVAVLYDDFGKRQYHISSRPLERRRCRFTPLRLPEFMTSGQRSRGRKRRRLRRPWSCSRPSSTSTERPSLMRLWRSVCRRSLRFHLWYKPADSYRMVQSFPMGGGERGTLSVVSLRGSSQVICLLSGREISAGGERKDREGLWHYSARVHSAACERDHPMNMTSNIALGVYEMR